MRTNALVSLGVIVELEIPFTMKPRESCCGLLALPQEHKAQAPE